MSQLIDTWEQIWEAGWLTADQLNIIASQDPTGLTTSADVVQDQRLRESDPLKWAEQHYPIQPLHDLANAAKEGLQHVVRGVLAFGWDAIPPTIKVVGIVIGGAAAVYFIAKTVKSLS